MLGDLNVRDAERRVATQKMRVRERWDELRVRGRDALVSPAALIAFAVMGGVAGWRSRRVARVSAAPAPRGLLRGVVSGLLQSLAVAAIDQTLKRARQNSSVERKPDNAA